MRRDRTIISPRFIVWAREVCLFLALACSCSAAFDSDRTIAQFAHTTWGPKDGAPSLIRALAQTSDGYLWLGSGDGLYRFDGVAFERYQPPLGGSISARAVSSLLAATNGDLWIGFRSGGITRLRSGHAISYTTNEGAPNTAVLSLAQDAEGGIWAASSAGLVRLEGDRWKGVGKDWNFTGQLARTIFLDRQGTLWISTEDTVVFLPRGARRFQPTGMRLGAVMQICEAPSGKLWMAETTRSVRPAPLSARPLAADETEIKVGSEGILFDSAGGLWITTVGDGLRHAPAPELLRGKIGEFSTAIESFTVKDGLSDDISFSILHDREENIWVGSRNGLDRFRKTNLVPIAPPFDTYEAVLAAENTGGIWLENQGRISHIQRGHAPSIELFRGKHLPLPTSYGVHSAFRDPAGAIWWVCSTGIYGSKAGSPAMLALPPSLPKPYRESEIVATEHGAGKLWLAAKREGLFYLKEGVWQRPKGAPEFAKLSPLAAFSDGMGRAWFGFQEGTIILLKDENIQEVFSAEDSSVGSVRVIKGTGRHIWVGGEGGLAFFDGARFRRIIPADAEAFGSVMGIEETPDGSLWLAESRGVIKIPATEVQRALNDSFYRASYRLFDTFDGLPGKLIPFASLRREALGTDGILWFVASGGIAWIDPANVFTNPFPPPVSIWSVKTNGRQLDSLGDLHLPRGTTELQINYTALSLSVPERVRFRYRLEGVDNGWQEAGTRREAFYTRLGPGNYHFQVIACNNDGVWNETGASLGFFILPAWYQTARFRAACALAFLLLLWIIYQLRIRQLQRQFAIGLDARVNERTRIARELHDTLLQTFHGLMFQFQAARNLLPRRPDEAMQSLDDAINDTEKALAESRDAIQGLRSEPMAQENLADALNAVKKEFVDTTSAGRELPTFDSIEEGERRALAPTAKNEICRIALELLRNAFHHADASRIEAEIRYDDHALRIRIRDNGRGIDPKLLKEGGRAGHWGLKGVRERAEKLGARLEFWSEAGAGTEVELTVPAPVAYEISRDGIASRLIRKVRSYARHS